MLSNSQSDPESVSNNSNSNSNSESNDINTPEISANSSTVSLSAPDTKKPAESASLAEVHETKFGWLQRLRLGDEYCRVKDHVSECFKSISERHVLKSEFMDVCASKNVWAKVQAEAQVERSKSPDDTIPVLDAIDLARRVLRINGNAKRPQLDKALADIAHRCPSTCVPKAALLNALTAKDSTAAKCSVGDGNLVTALQNDDNFQDATHIHYRHLKTFTYEFLTYTKNAAALRAEFAKIAAKSTSPNKDAVSIVTFYDNSTCADILNQYTNCESVNALLIHYMSSKKVQRAHKIVGKACKDATANSAAPVATMLTRESLNGMLEQMRPVYGKRVDKDLNKKHETVRGIENKVWKHEAQADLVRGMAHIAASGAQSGSFCVERVQLSLHEIPEDDRERFRESLSQALTYNPSRMEAEMQQLQTAFCQPGSVFMALAKAALSEDNFGLLSDLCAPADGAPHVRMAFALILAAIYRRLGYNISDNRGCLIEVDVSLDEEHDFNQDELLKALLRRNGVFDRFDVFVCLQALAHLGLSDGTWTHSLESISSATASSFEHCLIHSSVLEVLSMPAHDYIKYEIPNPYPAHLALLNELRDKQTMHTVHRLLCFRLDGSGCGDDESRKHSRPKIHGVLRHHYKTGAFSKQDAPQKLDPSHLRMNRHYGSLVLV